MTELWRVEISAETRAAMLVAGNYIEEKGDVGGQWETQGRLLETIGTANAIFGGTRLDSWTIRFCGGFFLKAETCVVQSLDFNVDFGDGLAVE